MRSHGSRLVARTGDRGPARAWAAGGFPVCAGSRHNLRQEGSVTSSADPRIAGATEVATGASAGIDGAREPAARPQQPRRWSFRLRLGRRLTPVRPAVAGVPNLAGRSDPVTVVRPALGGPGVQPLHQTSGRFADCSHAPEDFRERLPRPRLKLRIHDRRLAGIVRVGLMGYLVPGRLNGHNSSRAREEALEQGTLQPQKCPRSVPACQDILRRFALSPARARVRRRAREKP
jgi:hypothetical protein